MSHEVEFTVPKRDLGKADVEFAVKKGGKKLGELHVSKGSIVWFARDDSYGYKMSWSDFGEMMKTHAVKEERR
jgi:hypothetical protein